MSDLDREEICPDCQATEDNRYSRIMRVHKDKSSGEHYTVVTWHLQDCPTYTIEEILMEDGVRRAKEKEVRGQQAFPVARERVLRAVASREFAPEAEPFVAALAELVEAQAEDTGRFVTLDRWADILDRHFPPKDDPLARPSEEPSP